MVCAVLTFLTQETVLADSITTKERSKDASLRVLHALIELIAHFVVVAALLGSIWLLEKFIHYLWGATDVVFFGRLRLRHIIDGADLAILVGFVIWGVYSVVAAYIRKPKL
jgi:hypothetical protein